MKTCFIREDVSLRRFLVVVAAVIHLVLLLLTIRPTGAQLAVSPLDQNRGVVSLGLMLRRLATVGIFMQATAHPDDESNGLLVMLNRGQGYRTVLATATRGNGGQNEIGSELFEALGVLRTEELAAVHRFDGAEQYFTRAVDFGYSFSIEETFEKWGKREIIGDYVRLIRMVRPDVMTTMQPAGTGGGQHHQASALLATEAFRAAADPAQFPEQIREGLRPWQAQKLYHSAGFGFRGEQASASGAKMVSVESGVYDPLLGRTYAEIGTEARSMHKCQGMAQLLALPGTPSTSQYQLAETLLPQQVGKDEATLFDGIDTSIAGLARYAGAAPPPPLTQGLAAIAGQVENAQTQFNARGPAAALTPILAGLVMVRALRTELGGLNLADGARFEIDTRLKQKEDEFQQAAVIAQDLRIEALASDGLVVAGQPVRVTVLAANQGLGEVSIKRVVLSGFDADSGSCQPATVKKGGVFRCEASPLVPRDARLTAPYWERPGDEGRYVFEPDAPFGLPFRPTPFRARVVFSIGGAEVSEEISIVHRYEGNIVSGEKRMELHVVPALSVRVTPEIAIVPSEAVRASSAATNAGRTVGQNGRSRSTGARFDREIRVTVTNSSATATEARVALEAPTGWQVTPPSTSVEFSREDQAQTVRFLLAPAPKTKAGPYRVRALVTSNGQRYDRGYQVVEYPHIRRRHLYHRAETTIKVVDVRTVPNLTVGYVMGVGDEVPPAIEQLGARLDLIDSDQLAWGDLSRYDAIVTGVRAYERREDLRAHNRHLIEYARQGGTLIVQYNKFEFNEVQYGPYPANVSANRITDEQAPVTLLVPTHPVFNVPNKLDQASWKDWVQERGLYFLGERDPRYVDLVELEDPFPFNRGPKRGALVEVRVGKGRWVYVGLGLWRQLPAGANGAYQLLANLLSLGKAPTSSGVPR